MPTAMKAVVERTIIFSIAAVYIVLQVAPLEELVYLLGGLVFAAIALLLPKLKGMTLWLTSFFVAAGVVLLAVQQVDAKVWFESAGINVTIVTLFLFAPLFGIPVRIPAYVESLKRFYDAKLRSKNALFIGTQLLTQIMGVFINVGSIPVYQMVFVKPQPGMSLLLANALNRGFAGAILWSPYFAAMTLVTSSLRLPWSSVLPYMLGLALLSLVVSLLVDYRKLQHAELEAADQLEETDKATGRFPFELGIYLIAAILVILVMERLIELPMVLLICIAAVGFPLLWCLVKGAMSVYRAGIKTHVTVTLQALQKEITLFLAAGFFSGSIGITNLGTMVPSLLDHVPLPISVTFSILTVMVIAGTSLIGLHPIVPVTMLAGGIDPVSVQISPTYFAVLLLGSWALSNPISPASAVNNLLSGLLGKSVFELAAPNYKFAGVMAVSLLIYVVLALG